jgi:tetratricopeptide (TPR) repeat protein
LSTPETEPTLQEPSHLECQQCGFEDLDNAVRDSSATVCPVCGTEFGKSEVIVEVPSEVVSKNPAPKLNISNEALMLERLIETPPIPNQAPGSLLGIIFFVILAVGVGIYFIAQKPDKFAPTQENMTSSTAAVDSAALFQKRLAAQPVLDSLERAVKANPKDQAALLLLADNYFDTEYWDRARKAFATYLVMKPSDVDARVDYATTIVRADDDPELAITQIEKALEYNPNHALGLYNAGFFSLRKSGANHMAGLEQAKSYFNRARKAAETSNPQMVETIDKILSELEKMPGADAQGTATPAE